MIIDTGPKVYSSSLPPMTDLKVKVTDLEILYLIPDNVKFMTTNDQTIAQEILSRAKMRNISSYRNDSKYWDR